jgi:signal transduction histidine kinase
VRIDRIIRGLLDYARPRQAAPRPLDVNAIVRQVLDLLEAQGRFKEIRLDARLGDPLPAVRADPTQLEQVLVNLMLNASEAVADGGGGSIAISTAQDRHRLPGSRLARRRDDPPGVDYSHLRRFHRIPGVHPEAVFRNGARLVKIVVQDDGAGIPPDLVERIFEPFFTTKDPGRGTGLGLAVASRLVEGMGGVIQAANLDGGGAAFTVLLPVGGADGEGDEDEEESEDRE